MYVMMSAFHNIKYKHLMKKMHIHKLNNIEQTNNINNQNIYKLKIYHKYTCMRILICLKT